MAERSFSSYLPKPSRKATAADLADRMELIHLDVSADEERLTRILEASFNDAMGCDNRQRFEQQFIESYEMVEGEQYPETVFMPTDGNSFRATDNRIFGTIETISAILQESLPVAYVIAESEKRRARRISGTAGLPNTGMFGQSGMASQLGGMSNPLGMVGYGYSEKDAAAFLTDELHELHENREEHLRLGYVIQDQIVGGLGLRKVYHDKWTGQPHVARLYPLDFAVDAACCDPMWETARIFFYIRELDADVVMREFGLSKAETTELLNASGHEYLDEFGVYRRRQRKPLATGNFLSPPRSEGESVARPRLIVREAWTVGHSLFEMESDGNKDLKRPFGRVFSWVGNKLLRVADNPYEGRLPFIGFHNYGDPQDPYGYGNVKPLTGNQITLNVLMSQIVMNTILMANAQWLVEEGALAYDDPTNEPGLIITALQGMIDRVKKLSPESVPMGAFRVMEWLEGNIQNVSNVSELSQGAMPQTHTPGYAIQLMQDKANAPIRKKGRLFEHAFKRQCLLEVYLLQKYGVFYEPLEQGQMNVTEWEDFHRRIENLAVDIQIESKMEIPAGFAGKYEFAMRGLESQLMDKAEAAAFTGYPISEKRQAILNVEQEATLATLRLQKAQAELQLAQTELQTAQMRAQLAQMTGGGMPMANGVNPQMPAPIPAFPAQTAAPPA